MSMPCTKKFEIEYSMQCEHRTFTGREVVEAENPPKEGEYFGMEMCGYNPSDDHCSVCPYGIEGSQQVLKKLVISVREVGG